MNKEILQAIVDDIADNSPTNFLQPKITEEEAKKQLEDKNNWARNNWIGNAPFDPMVFNKDKDDKYIGLKFFERPIFIAGDALDPAYETLKDEKIVGPHHKIPTDWMPDAKRVLVFFLPFSDRVVESNIADPINPSLEWMFTRVDGQQHLLATGRAIVDALKEAGYKAVAPQLDDEYLMRTSVYQTNIPIPSFSSNWSERHVAYIAGMGTFGLHTNFISKAGCAGRLISIITDWECDIDEKDYDHHLDYCNECGSCVKRCPAGAVTPDFYKDHTKCQGFIQKTCAPFVPRYGCGKCQSGIPCTRQPMKKKK